MCGYSTRMYGLTNALTKLGHKITIIVPRRNKNWREIEDDGNIRVIRIYPFKGIYGSLNTIKKVNKLTNIRNYDIIHAHNPLKYGLCAYLGSFSQKLPFIYELHHPTFYRVHPTIAHVNNKNNRIWELFEKFIFYKSDKIMVISNEIKDKLIKKGISADKISLLPNGVNIDKFSVTQKNELIQRKYNLHDKKVILFLGTFQPWEELDKLVKVFAKIKERQNNVKLLLVGDGPDRKKIEKTIREYNLTKYVTITGFVPFSDVPKYYSVCDVFVMVRPDMPLTQDTTPIKPFEAMAAGKVVISTDLKAMREIIEDGKTGFLVPHSIDAIADKIIEVLNNPQLQEEIGANARRYIKENKDWKVIINNLVNAYEEAILKKNTGIENSEKTKS